MLAPRARRARRTSLRSATPGIAPWVNLHTLKCSTNAAAMRPRNTSSLPPCAAMQAARARRPLLSVPGRQLATHAAARRLLQPGRQAAWVSSKVAVDLLMQRLRGAGAKPPRNTPVRSRVRACTAYTLAGWLARRGRCPRWPARVLHARISVCAATRAHRAWTQGPHGRARRTLRGHAHRVSLIPCTSGDTHTHRPTASIGRSWCTTPAQPGETPSTRCTVRQGGGG